MIAAVRRMRKRSVVPKFLPRYSLLFFFLICFCGSLIVAWVGINHQLNRTPAQWAGFPPGTPRQEGFIEPGRLTFDVIEDIHGGNGLHARLHVRIKLNHDRVFSHSIESSVREIRYACYSLHDSLVADDPAFIEDFVERHLESYNGNSAVESVTLINSQIRPKTQLQSSGIQPQ